MVKPDNKAAAFDPRGLIFESYRIEGITLEEARAIFFDWAMGSNEGAGGVDHIKALLEVYRAPFPDHPMTKTLEEGLGAAQKPRRRGGWRSRRT